MSGQVIIGMLFPGLMLGVVLCSMIFTVIINRNDKLRKSLENGDDSGRMLVYSYLAIQPTERRAADGTALKRECPQQMTGTYAYAKPRSKGVVYDFEYERKRRMR